MDTDIFKDPVSPEANAYIQRIYPLTRLFFVLSIVGTCFSFAFGLVRYILYTRIYQMNDGWDNMLYTRLYPFYEIIGGILVFIQGYYLLHYGRQCKKSIELQQPDLFHASFKLLLRFCMVACVIFLFQLIGSILFLWSDIRLLLGAING